MSSELVCNPIQTQRVDIAFRFGLYASFTCFKDESAYTFNCNELNSIVYSQSKITICCCLDLTAVHSVFSRVEYSCSV